MKDGTRSSLFAALFFPDSKRHQTTAAITEKHLELPADRSQNQIRNLLYYNRSSLITLDRASELNRLIDKQGILAYM